MKNWNDAGTVHFDAETNEIPVECFVAGRVHGVEVKVSLLVPLKIKKALKEEHWQQAELIVARDYILCMNKAIEANVPVHKLKEATLMALRLSICAFLYQQFTLEQNRAGNDVWATPETMQEIGPKPEDDMKYLM